MQGLHRTVNLAQPTGLGPGPHGLGPKKATQPKKPPTKKPTGPNSPQNPCGPGLAHGLFSKHEKKKFI